MRLADRRAQVWEGRQRGKDRQRMAFADAAQARQGARRATRARQAGKSVYPAPQQIRSGIRKMVCGQRPRRVVGIIANLIESLRLNEILYLIRSTFHRIGWNNWLRRASRARMTPIRECNMPR